MVHELFSLYLEEGITDIAEGSTSLDKAYKNTHHPHLTALTAGRLMQNPSTYFEAGHVTKILELSSPRFDFVIMDCAPVMPVVDPLVVAKDVTGILLVVKAGATHRDLVKQASEVLQKAGAPLVGVLLNNVMQVLPYYYSYRYAYQDYRPETGRKAPEH